MILRAILSSSPERCDQQQRSHIPETNTPSMPLIPPDSSRRNARTFSQLINVQYVSSVMAGGGVRNERPMKLHYLGGRSGTVPQACFLLGPHWPGSTEAVVPRSPIRSELILASIRYPSEANPAPRARKHGAEVTEESKMLPAAPPNSR